MTKVQRIWYLLTSLCPEVYHWNREEIFKITIFNNELDTIRAQLNIRFTDMSAVCQIFFCLSKFLLDVDEATLLQKCDQFQNKYSDIIGPNFSL